MRQSHAVSFGHPLTAHSFSSILSKLSVFLFCLAVPAASSSCAGNTATTRSEWCDYSIDTNYTETAPTTNITREFWFELTDTTVSPDGVERYAMAINGSVPGPTIVADWGDTVIVHVTNSLSSSTNGTSLHFHGIRQNYTNQNDGVASITQCPTPPGSTVTYTWKALQYGSSWYHSHFGLQAWQGVFGGIIINGPATANYDEDMGVMLLNDWSHETPDALFLAAQTQGPPTLENGLINGTNVYGSDDDDTQTGYRWNATWTEGTSYRLRLVNGAIDTHFKFSIDNHTLTVISMDLVPVTPFTANIISIGMGQRYDVIVTADQASTADSFWLRAVPQSACSDNDSSDNIRGIIYYEGSSTTPTTTAYSYIDSCDGLDTSSLVPYVSMTVGSSDWSSSEQATVGFNSANMFRWYLNSTTMIVEWDNPTILQVYSNETDFETSNAVLEVDADEWIYVVVQTTLAVPHPIHLHGHDFFVLAQGTGTYDDSNVSLNLENPPRRDTAMLPASGYLVMAFYTDNPGAWLMHCHIGWHTSEGFAIQWVERRSEYLDLIDGDALNNTCAAWSSYQEANSMEQEDSGI